ncbi:hypothetical protein JX265_007460 [Neoarthrinium moseri]|uniref:Noranthrone monooxygenase n=1 Tax=Neoarthrinium moseri TaxID=1658444 RepID=A0A9P9WKC5_9PEZI|nr:uncharacterized protein JN550_009816 [Neoarthrinium moseri]KAI1841393.1 hypothetical protein JX266_012404 [Neoarthrinium moseri]KAI1863080.1 hypothetical protein JN550_009816 [Neoarthrinium moseri]KAI1867658.1 hypothetical protein JX265_007460 [Neoarthrinium moseri]
MSLSPGLTLAASASIVGSAAAAGAIAALSGCAIPAVLGAGAPTEVMLRQWYIIFNRGKAIPLTSLISALSYGAVSYGTWSHGLPQWKGFALSGLFAAASIPFTIAFLMPTNNALEAAAHSEVRTLSDDKVRGLITKWMKINNIRIFIPLSGAILGLWTLLG